MAEIDLDLYFERVGYDGPRTATLETFDQEVSMLCIQLQLRLRILTPS